MSSHKPLEHYLIFEGKGETVSVLIVDVRLNQESNPYPIHKRDTIIGFNNCLSRIELVTLILMWIVRIKRVSLDKKLYSLIRI